VTAFAGATILVVDDDEAYRMRLSRAFERRGFRVLRAGDGDEAIALSSSAHVSFACVDLRMPGRSGLEVVRALRQATAAPVVIVLTGYGSIATAVEAVRLGAAHYVTKPADASDVLAAFARATQDVPPMATTFEIPSLARAEWEHINRALADCGGNISQAARLLRIQRRSLQRKLAKFPAAR
jgi:two-component system response regulator RegA